MRRLKYLRVILLNGLYNLKFLRLLIFEIVPRSEILRYQLTKNMRWHFRFLLKLPIANYSVVFLCSKKSRPYKRKCERCRSYKGFISISPLCLSAIPLLSTLLTNFPWRFSSALCMEHVGFTISTDIHSLVVSPFSELLNILFVLLPTFKRYLHSSQTGTL